MWKRVTIRVRIVNTKTAGTARRARPQVRSRDASNSKIPLDQYEAPRNAAVMWGLIVQAKYFAVWSPTSSSGAPARNTSRLATTSIQLIAVLVWRYGISRRDTIA